MKFATLILGGMDTSMWDMIRHQMPFQNLNPLCLQSIAEFLYTFTELCEDYFPSIFWSKDDMIICTTISYALGYEPFGS